MRLRLLILYLSLVTLSCSLQAQDSLDKLDRLINFPTSYIEKLQRKSADLENKLIDNTEKYLIKLSRHEQKLYRKLRKIDSAKAEELFAKSQEQYAALISKIKNPINQVSRATGEYHPYIDSINGSLGFLMQNQNLLGSSSEIQEKVSKSLSQVNTLNLSFKEADEVKAFISNRKDLIRQTLSRFTTLPTGLKMELDRINRDIFYYCQQVREYKEILNDPDRLTLKALSLLNKLPAFAEFMKTHSELAGLFSIPGGYGSAQGAIGLQTTAQVRQLIMQQAGSGSNGMVVFQQNLQAAQTQLGQLKDKLNQLGGGSGDIEMPDFKPRNQKTKTFWKRIEYGVNLQSNKANYFFPNSTEVGLSLGYKTSDNSVLGVGLSYRVGWGKNISHIVVTHEGIGLRSFFDMKVKGSFFATAGFEYNYQKPFSSVDQLKALDDWQRSGLAGITKIISLRSKVAKKTKVQLLWDYLSYYQRPVTQPLKFRIGYNF